MLRLTITLLLICTSLLEGFSDTPFVITQKADSLFKVEDYRAASLEYERMAYGAESNAQRTEAIVRKSDCLVALENYHNAKTNLLRINYFDLPDSLIFEARFKTAYCAYLDEDFSLTSSQMFLIRQYLPSEYHHHTSLLYALSLNESREWNKSLELLEGDIANTSIPQAQKDSIISVLQGVYREKKQPKYKDPEKARNLSSVIPGLGQLYAGYPQDAAFTWLFLSVGLAAGAYTAIALRYIVTGLSIWAGIGERLYSGGVKRSGFLAEKKNYTSARKYNDMLKLVLLELDFRA